METQPPETPSSRTLAILPAETIQHIANFLHLRDRFHLVLTSRTMYDRVVRFLYLMDAQQDRRALRWACYYGELATLERALTFAPPGLADDYLPDEPFPRVEWSSFLEWDYDADHDLEQTSRGSFHDTPLITAVRRNHISAVRMLLARGADPNKTDRAPRPPKTSLWGPLHWALRPPFSHPDFREPANLSRRNRFVPNFEMVELLLEAGADPNKPTTPWDESLEEGDDTDKERPSGMLRATPFKRPPGREARLPLELAAGAYGPVDTFELLLKAGADPTLPSRMREDRRTPGYQKALDCVFGGAIKRTGVAKAELLLNHEAGHYPGWDTPNRNLTCEPDLTLEYRVVEMMYAGGWRCASKKPPQLDLCLRLLGAVLESGKKKGLGGHIDTEIHGKTYDHYYLRVKGRNALQLAAILPGALIETSADRFSPEPAPPAAIGSVEKHTSLSVPIMRFLLDAGADPLATDSFGRTVLHAAAAADCRDGLLVLLEIPGVRELVNQPDAQGRTPLHLAAQVPTPHHWARTLADHPGSGVKSYVPTADRFPNGVHPDSGADGTWYLPADTVNILLQAGADRSIRDAEGKTALDLARQESNRRAVVALKKKKHPELTLPGELWSFAVQKAYKPPLEWLDKAAGDRWPFGVE